ncbi:hypothetical protein ACIQWV_31785 [Streptomyces sp. NPDC098085]|uniref:hypothetical protein n=1 Tax=Streptomyces sp. NPDC098085 TaxID=3366094 RepID=UPI00380A3428
MQPAVPADTAPPPRSPLAATLAVAPRVLLALVPVVTLGVFAFVPALVIAARRRRPADWLACAVFAVACAAWCLRIALTPAETEGPGFAVDLLLLLGTTLGAAVHSLCAWPARNRPDGDVVEAK